MITEGVSQENNTSEKITLIYHIQSNNNNDNVDRDDGNGNFQTKYTTMPALQMQCWQIGPITPPGSFILLPPKAIAHNLRNMIVGGISVGNQVCLLQGANQDRVSNGGWPKNSNDTTKRQPRECGCCRENNDKGAKETMYIYKGKGGHGRIDCKYFDKNNYKI